MCGLRGCVGIHSTHCSSTGKHPHAYSSHCQHHVSGIRPNAVMAQWLSWPSTTTKAVEVRVHVLAKSPFLPAYSLSSDYMPTAKSYYASQLLQAGMQCTLLAMFILTSGDLHLYYWSAVTISQRLSSITSHVWFGHSS